MSIGLNARIDELCAARERADEVQTTKLRNAIIAEMHARDMNQSRCAEALGLTRGYVNKTLRCDSWTSLVSLGRRIAALP
jgi:predicted XRE-type DNA-binding protein